MAEEAVKWADEGRSFDDILANIQTQIDGTSAYIMVDDLNHLVKGGRLSNGAAILGNLLSIKPILYFNEEGVIEVYEKVRTEKKAIKRLAEIVKTIRSLSSMGMHWIKRKLFAIFFIKMVFLVRFHLRPLAVSLVRT